MTHKFLAATTILLSSLALTVSPLLAAAPDGSGPWADFVVSLSQGLRKNGSAVLPVRSQPEAALGAPENNTVNGSFVSLGFGGQVTLGFLNPVKNSIVIVEATTPPYPIETATLEVSPDGSNWTIAGSVTNDASLALPANICARYIRITDTSNPALFANDADGFDVDAIRSVEGDACPTPEVPEFNALTSSITLLMAGAAIYYLRRQNLLSI